MRKFSLSLAAIFLSMQIFSFLHMAEHDFHEHEHNGVKCEVQLHLNQQKTLASAAPEFHRAAIYITVQTAILETRIFSPENYSVKSPRAPPHILQA